MVKEAPVRNEEDCEKKKFWRKEILEEKEIISHGKWIPDGKEVTDLTVCNWFDITAPFNNMRNLKFKF